LNGSKAPIGRRFHGKQRDDLEEEVHFDHVAADEIDGGRT
jgi:hypothetical protein